MPNGIGASGPTREEASQATTPPNLPTPADAITVDDWDDWDDGEYWRMFRSWAHRACCVSIRGLQFSGGHVERVISCDVAEDDEMTAGDARLLAAALVEAADRLDGLR